MKGCEGRQIHASSSRICLRALMPAHCDTVAARMLRILVCLAQGFSPGTKMGNKREYIVMRERPQWIQVFIRGACATPTDQFGMQRGEWVKRYASYFLISSMRAGTAWKRSATRA
jgi:hypothetical protein